MTLFVRLVKAPRIIVYRVGQARFGTIRHVFLNVQLLKATNMNQTITTGA